jgi:hypothetical protein
MEHIDNITSTLLLYVVKESTWSARRPIMLKVQLSSMQKKLKKTTETGTGEQLMNKTQAVMSNFISIILHKIGTIRFFLKVWNTLSSDSNFLWNNHHILGLMHGQSQILESVCALFIGTDRVVVYSEIYILRSNQKN